MAGHGSVQVLKMPLAAKSNQVASNVTLHISFPQDGKRPSPAGAPTPDQAKSGRLPSLRHNTKVVTLTSSSPKLQRGSAKTISPFPDLRVGLPKIADSNRPSDDGKKRRLPTKAKSFMQSSRTVALDEQPKVFNPEPVAFHPQLFNDALNKVRVDGMTLSTKSDNSSNRPESAKRKHPSNRSSNAVHKAEVTPRHGEMWSGADSPLGSKSFILHSDRHQWDDLFGSLSKLTERERMAMEFDYLDRLRNLKKRREVIPHRESMDFIMGGQKVELSERENADVYQELKRLKSMVLPAVARDLYVGRGFKLPKKHALNKPRVGVFDGDSPALSLTMMSGQKPFQTTPSAAMAVYKKTAHYRHSVQAGNKAKVAAGSGKSTDGAPAVPGSSSAENRVGDSKDSQNVPETSAVGERSEETAPLPTPEKQLKPNLLQAIDVTVNLGIKEIEEIKDKYQALPHTDEGKTEFSEIKPHLPTDLNSAQEQYLKKVFEMCSSGGSFKEDDFMSLYSISKKISTLSGAPLEAFNKLDESKLEGNIAKFGELFETVDRQQTGKITITSLHELLHTALEADDLSTVLDAVIPVIDPESEGSVSKLDYLAYVPYFLSLVP